jgi:hypothetical protein
MKREESFQGIDQINQKVINEAIENHRVQNGGQRALVEHGLLGEDDPQCIQDTLWHTVKPRVRLAADDGLGDTIEPNPRVEQAHNSQEQEQDLLYGCQHILSSLKTGFCEETTGFGNFWHPENHLDKVAFTARAESQERTALFPLQITNTICPEWFQNQFTIHGRRGTEKDRYRQWTW